MLQKIQDSVYWKSLILSPLKVKTPKMITTVGGKMKNEKCMHYMLVLKNNSNATNNSNAKIHSKIKLNIIYN